MLVLKKKKKKKSFDIELSKKQFIERNSPTSKSGAAGSFWEFLKLDSGEEVEVTPCLVVDFIFCGFFAYTH